LEAEQAAIQAQTEADAKEAKDKIAAVAAEAEAKKEEIKKDTAERVAAAEEGAKKADEEFLKEKAAAADKAAKKMEAVQAAQDQAEKDLEAQTAKQSAKLQKEAAEKAKADAQVNIKQAEEKIATEIKAKVAQEKTEASEDLSPLEAEIEKWRKKTALVKRHTKEMLAHGHTHFSEGLDKLGKINEKHGEEMKDFGNEQSVQTVAYGEEQLNYPLIAGLAFVNVLTAGFAFSYYRSTKQMRNFHSSLLEF